MTHPHVCAHTLDLHGQQVPLAGLQSRVSTTSLQPFPCEVHVKRLSRIVPVGRFVGLSPQASFAGIPVSSSFMGSGGAGGLPSPLQGPQCSGHGKEGTSTLHPVSAQHQGSLGPCWGPRAAYMTSLSSTFLICSMTTQLHPLCLLSQAGFVAQEGQ